MGSSKCFFFGATGTSPQVGGRFGEMSAYGRLKWSFYVAETLLCGGFFDSRKKAKKAWGGGIKRVEPGERKFKHVGVTGKGRRQEALSLLFPSLLLQFSIFTIFCPSHHSATEGASSEVRVAVTIMTEYLLRRDPVSMYRSCH